MAGVHHVELWVADFSVAEPVWDWLFARLGWVGYQSWHGGRSWRSGVDPGAAYVCVEQSPDLVIDVVPDRRRVGLNHLALHVDSVAQLDALMQLAPDRGWTHMFAECYPYAGGESHYAGYLENADGFEVELVASR